MNREAKYQILSGVLRVIASFAVLVAFVSVLGWAFRAELSRFGEWFVLRFGVAGMGAGAFLADSVHFPLPPQFYFFTGIAGGHESVVVVLAILFGSELGGLTAFMLARGLGRAPVISRRLQSSRDLLTGLIERRGYLGLAAATLLPISFSILCMASGAMRLPYKAYGVLALMRVPKILLSCVVILFAWPA